ncbi:hypothetical protein BDQ17DRAFT_258910 [Cyathus striatus]|nr:hypothetical protein BDQ17DRAFT_258910 [Cyathus striatus]
MYPSAIPQQSNFPMYHQNGFNPYVSPHLYGNQTQSPSGPTDPSTTSYGANGSPQQNNYSWYQHNGISPYASPHMYGYQTHRSSVPTPPSIAPTYSGTQATRAFEPPLLSYPPLNPPAVPASYREPRIPFIPPSPSSGIETPGPATPSHPLSYPGINNLSSAALSWLPSRRPVIQAPKSVAQSPPPQPPPQLTSPRHRTATQNDSHRPTPLLTPSPGSKVKGFISYTPPPTPPLRPLTTKGKWYLQCAGITEEEMRQAAKRHAQKWREQGLWLPGRRPTSPSSESSFELDKQDRWKEQQERENWSEQERQGRRQEQEEQEQQQDQEQSEKYEDEEPAHSRAPEKRIEQWRVEAGTSTPEEWEADIQHWIERRDAYITRSRHSSEQNSQRSAEDKHSRVHDRRGRSRRPKALEC